jgi:hypothetical protein
MKKILRFSLFVLFLLSACSPAEPTATAVPERQPAVAIDGCTLAPHEFMNQGGSIPIALVTNPPQGSDPQLIWWDGSLLGSWHTGSPIQISKAHVIGFAPDGVGSLGLVYLGSDIDGATRLLLNRAGVISPLTDFPVPAFLTDLIGVPQKATIVYATVAPSADGSRLHSTVYLAEVEPALNSRAFLEADRSDSRYLRPVAIHRDVNDQADGVWYTTDLWGIGGDSLTDQRAGLYYLDLVSGLSREFLSQGCGFSSLSKGQNFAVWTSAGVVHVSDMHTGTDRSFPLLAGNDRGPVQALLSPSEGYLAWLEGRGWQYDGTLETTLRVGIVQGTQVYDYPLSAFSEPAGLGPEIGIRPLGWLSPNDELLLVAVYSVSEERSVLVYLDVNANQISLLTEGTLVGFAYP